MTAPGVLAVLTSEDLRRRGLGTLMPVGTLMPGVRRRRRNGAAAFVCPQPLLARDRVRYVGDPVAFVVAETLNQAKDAAELIEIEYQSLPAVISAEASLAPGAPSVWDDNPGNEAFFHEIGDKNAVDAAFAQADHIVRHTMVINRVTANSMEPRAVSPNTTGTRIATRSAAPFSRCMPPGRHWPIGSSNCRTTNSVWSATIWVAALG
jgi:aerobic carbon-monoxide dehydrogenase large subunit